MRDHIASLIEAAAQAVGAIPKVEEAEPRGKRLVRNHPEELGHTGGAL